ISSFGLKMSLFRLCYVVEMVTYLRVCSHFDALPKQKMNNFHLQKRNLNKLLVSDGVNLHSKKNFRLVSSWNSSNRCNDKNQQYNLFSFPIEALEPGISPVDDAVGAIRAPPGSVLPVKLQHLLQQKEKTRCNQLNYRGFRVYQVVPPGLLKSTQFIDNQ
ncbi:MAG: hypothetical protein KDF58_13810, partial [Alphaproteobacteria bacterium]|nr:hypothetical protein [Alphaproteobacteria bacterium]